MARLRGLLNPANAACIAAILAALGVIEIEHRNVEVILEAVAIVIAAIGIIGGWMGGASAGE